MLVFPQWRPEIRESGCRVPRWMPAERFAPYLARPVVFPPLPSQQYEDDDSSGSSSPERVEVDSEGTCGWRGCGVQLPSVARLSAHVARIHALAHADGLFYCGWKGCSRPHKGFNARYKMLVHVRTHTNERPHTCNQCNKSFSRAENLKIHLRSHSGEKPYVCPYEGCGKAYSNSSDRFKHTRTHTVDKPYCCKVQGCDKRYTDPSSLRKHVKTYKHFTNDEKRDFPEELKSETYSPLRQTELYHPSIEHNPAVVYSPPTSLSPTIPPYNPLSLREPVSMGYQMMNRVTYIRPIESYPLRIPSNEMPYTDYAQMYEHAYRNYYPSYPVLRPTFEENFNYEQTKLKEVAMENIDDIKNVSYNTLGEVPLNLCAKRIECKPLEKLAIRADLPLDLSFKS